MVSVRIGAETRDINDATESWITQEVQRWRKANGRVCVQVSVDLSGLKMLLSTQGCGASGGGGRSPNQNESEIFSLWADRGLNRIDVSPGNLVAFLKQFRRVAAA